MICIPAVEMVRLFLTESWGFYILCWFYEIVVVFSETIELRIFVKGFKG